jgi:HAD superfamily hydrolase (TIGR01490 family)
MVRRIDEHRARGHLIALLSSTTNYLADPLAEELGIEHLLVTKLIVVDGCFTGEVERPLCYGAGKLHWARRFALEHDVDLAQSFFYTDSVTDVPMLEIVGHPQIVNPDPILRRVARRRGWSILPVEPARMAAHA